MVTIQHNHLTCSLRCIHNSFSPLTRGRKHFRDKEPNLYFFIKFICEKFHSNMKIQKLSVVQKHNLLNDWVFLEVGSKLRKQFNLHFEDCNFQFIFARKIKCDFFNCVFPLNDSKPYNYFSTPLKVISLPRRHTCAVSRTSHDSSNAIENDDAVLLR